VKEKSENRFFRKFYGHGILAAMAEAVHQKKVEQFDIEGPSVPMPLTTHVSRFLGKVNWWYPVQLLNTGIQRVYSLFPDGTPELVKAGHSYNVAFAIDNLEKRGSLLNGTTFRVWMNYLKRASPKPFEWIEEPSITDGLGNLNELVTANLAEISKKPRIDFITIPIIVQGYVEKHLVHVLIELREHEVPLIEFLDPFGYEASDEAATILKAVNTFYESSKPHIHNKTLQNDRHNCGVVVSWHLYQRMIHGISPEKISSLPLDFEAFRKEMVRLIKS